MSYLEVGLLLSIPNAASALFEPAVAILGDVWRRRALIVGGAAYALALLLVSASFGFASLLVAFLVLYPAAGSFVSLSQASLMDLEPEARERNMVRSLCWRCTCRRGRRAETSSARESAARCAAPAARRAALARPARGGGPLARRAGTRP